MLTAPHLVSLKVSLIHACSCHAAIYLSHIVQAQESRPGTIASCMLEMSYLVEVLKDDQVDCPVEPPVGADQHKLTFIPIPKEDLYECAQTIRTVLLTEIDRLHLARPTTKVEKLNLVLDPRTKDFLSDSDKKACWSALEEEYERVVKEMQNDSDAAVHQQGIGHANKETGKQGEMKRSHCTA